MQEARKSVTNEILETGHIKADQVQIFKSTLEVGFFAWKPCI